MVNEIDLASNLLIKWYNNFQNKYCPKENNEPCFNVSKGMKIFLNYYSNRDFLKPDENIYSFTTTYNLNVEKEIFNRFINSNYTKLIPDKCSNCLEKLVSDLKDDDLTSEQNNVSNF